MSHETLRRSAPSLVLLAFIAGCAGPGAQQSASGRVNLSGFSAGFKQGYDDGCASSAARDGARRDEGRYKTDNEYMMGWNDGYIACRRR